MGSKMTSQVKNDVGFQSSGDDRKVNLNVQTLFKNKNRLETDYYWIYRSYYKEGWWFMSPEYNEYIEKNFNTTRSTDDTTKADNDTTKADSDTAGPIDDTAKADNDTAGPIDDTVGPGSLFIYDFDQMTQTSRKNGTVRDIRRITANDLEEMHREFLEELLKLDQIWLYETKSGFVPYQIKDQIQINNGNVTIFHGKYPFTIDKSTMCQTSSTGRKRDIMMLTNLELREKIDD